MNCDRAQAAISERMDGERLPGRVTAALDAHLEGCAACRTFATKASRVRTAVRIRPAERIPDLVAPIMAEVARTSPAARRRRTRRSWTLAPTAATLAVGLVAGSLVVGGPFRDTDSRPSASAAEVIMRVRAAARRVEAYHATFAITERGLSAEVPERTLEAELWFAAPGRYRLDVRDTTRYPSEAWTPTDLRYVESGTAVMTRAPTGCPAILPPGECPTTRSVVRDRTSYSTEAPLAADLVVPLDVLANPRGLTVDRAGVVLGRPAVLVRTTFARAAPLFSFLEIGGTWRPIFPQDRVDLWVDAQDWSPLRWTVLPADDPARADWELRFGLPPEPTDLPILEVAATATDHAAPTDGRFAAARAVASIPVSELPELAGFQPVTPTSTGDLALTRASVPSGEGAERQTLLTYSRGLAYLQVAERPRWGGGLFGVVGGDAERVDLGGGVAYYEPADREQGRRLAIHTGQTNLYLETNLSREELLTVAASLPIDGQAIPASWNLQRAHGVRTERLTLEQARDRASFTFDVPDPLPGGYVLASIERTVVHGRDGVTLTLRQRDSDLGAGPIRIHLETADALPPTAAPDQASLVLGEAGSGPDGRPRRADSSGSPTGSTGRSTASDSTCGP